MFSPDATVHVATTSKGTSSRNPRRRRRHDSDSLRQAPVRKRSKLTSDTFTSPADSTISAPRSSLVNGHADSARKSAAAAATPPTLSAMPLRKKSSTAVQRRSDRADGGRVLLDTANFALFHASATPPQLTASTRFRGVKHPNSHHALALTHDTAYIWNYEQNPRYARAITLPFTVKPTDTLPLGAFAGLGRAAELGLVVVHATDGTVVFWENIENAEAMSLFQQRRSYVEGRIDDIASGDYVEEIIPAQHVGYLLILHSGRVAQLTLRDTQGRPSINVHWLRSQSNNEGSGFFGSIRNMLSAASWRRDVVAVKTRPSRSRNQLTVIAATERGAFHFWDVDWTGQNTFKGTVDARVEITSALSETPGPNPQRRIEPFKVLDLGLLSGPANSTELVSAKDDLGVKVLLLVMIPSETSAHYALVEVELVNSVAHVNRVISINEYTGNPQGASEWRPRLLLPAHSLLALVLFPQAICLVSLRDYEDTPDMQLLGNTPPEQEYQDIIRLRHEPDLFVTGCADEDTSDSKGQCVLFINTYGVVRVTTLSDSTDSTASISAKSKIEQALLCKQNEGSIIDYTIKEKTAYPADQVEQAVLTIASEVMSSNSIVNPPGDLLGDTEKSLVDRLQIIENLADFVNVNFEPALSRATKFNLLWQAEKLSACLAMYLTYQEARKGHDADSSHFLEKTIEFLPKKYKTVASSDSAARHDPVRYWFAKDPERIERVLAWLSETVKKSHMIGSDNPAALLLLQHEANDIATASLGAARKYRVEKASLYGLGAEVFKHGRISGDFSDLDPRECWTALPSLFNALTESINMSLAMVDQYEEEAMSGGEANADDKQMLKQLGKDSTVLLEQWQLTGIECLKFQMVNQDEKAKADADVFRTGLMNQRATFVLQLTRLDYAQESRAFAERYHDMKLLAAIVQLEADECNDLLEQTSKVGGPLPDHMRLEVQAATASLESIQDFVKECFTKYGDKWAAAWYKSLIDENKVHGFLSEAQSNAAAASKFLHRGKDEEARFAKISWIHDTLCDDETVWPGKTLVNVARDNERQLWSRKVEAGLAKLSLLNTLEQDQDKAAEERNKRSVVLVMRQADSLLTIANIQDRVAQRVLPFTVQALDEDSALQEAMQNLGHHVMHARERFATVLEQCFQQILRQHVLSDELLMDCLSLIDAPTTDTEDDNAWTPGLQFALACQVLTLHRAAYDSEEHAGWWQCCIWARCLARTNWESFSKESARLTDSEVGDALEETPLFDALKHGLTLGLWLPTNRDNVPSPSQVKGFASGALAAQRSRWNDDAILHALLQDYQEDDARVTHYVDSCRLSHWFELCWTRAVDTFVADTDADEAETRHKRDELHRIAERVRNGLDAFGDSEDEDEADGEVDVIEIPDDDNVVLAVLPDSGSANNDDEESEVYSQSDLGVKNEPDANEEVHETVEVVAEPKTKAKPKPKTKPAPTQKGTRRTRRQAAAAKNAQQDEDGDVEMS